MLLFAAVLSVLAGGFVALYSQERRVRGWFLLMCLSMAAVLVGLWVETHSPTHAFVAARINVTLAPLAVFMSCTAGLIMCGTRWHRLPLLMLGAATALNVATVWLSDTYFTGAYVRYPWGGYAVANLHFVINPLLLAMVVCYTLVALAQRYPRAHALDRNRIAYVVLSWAILSLSFLDYLPHFGIDPFGGPVSAIAVPLFMLTFGYSLLRFRLIEFRTLALRSSGWLVTMILVGTVYVLVLEASRRWFHAGIEATHVGAAVLGLGVYSAVGQTIPGWFSRLAGAGRTQFQPVVDRFSDDMRGVLDEPTMRIRLETVCTGPLLAATVGLIDEQELAADPIVADAVSETKHIECEVLRRQSLRSPLLDRAEIIIPLRHHGTLLGALMLGEYTGGGQYPERLLSAARTIANVFVVALVNARSTIELEQRQEIDRYLAPQLLERALKGQATALVTRQRQTITTFFSDLQGFTPLADQLPPDVLSSILNQYLSAMSEVAIEHGGTIDKFIGDGVMVMFGAPTTMAPPMQVEHSLSMAIRMHERLAALNAEWRAKELIDEQLECRMGIHTGEATVGSFGSRIRADYTAIGSAVNLAARLETACRTGHALLTASTWELVRDATRLLSEPRGAINVKGFDAPVDVVEVDLTQRYQSATDTESPDDASP